MYLLGIDIGTTGTKTVLLNDKGTKLKSHYKSYGLIKSSNKVVEQKASDWWEALVLTIRECISDISDKENILALSISSQGGSLLLVDKYGNPLSNVISWMDNRGIQQQKDLLKLHDDDFYYKKTGWKLTAGGNLIQIRWLKENRPDIFEKTYRFLSTIDYINYMLTGDYIIDPTNAAMTNLFDIQKGIWDDELLNAAGILEQKLPEILESGKVVGNLTPEVAAQLGLSTSVKVINGGHDQYCAAIGAGAINDGELFLSAGTAWVLMGIFNEPVFNNKTYISPGRHIINGLWGALVSVSTGGISIEWFKDNFGASVLDDSILDLENEIHPESLKDVDYKASLVMERARDVYFYPYYNGSGYPNYNRDVRASFMGLGLEHDRYDMALAIMEGISFEVNHAIEEFRERGCRLEHLRMIGGGSKSKLWTEIIANVTGIPVITFKESEAACIGAAIIAGVGCGVFYNYHEGYNRIIKDEDIVIIDKIKREFYKQKYTKYKQGIKAIENYYKSLAENT